jgi:DNA-binding CsgD family transcriptional regulator
MAESPIAPHTASPAELKDRFDAERHGMAFLLYRADDGRQLIYTLEETSRGRITIGRADETDIPLTWDGKVSSVHAELERIGGDWTVADDGLSRNGTYVNGHRLQRRRRLRDGDTLRFGDTIVLYCDPAHGESGTTITAGGDPTAMSLSEAQRRVLIALCRPFKESGAYATPASNQQIAQELYLSVAVVKTHLRVLFHKFGVQDLPQNQKRADLVRRAFQSGMVSQRDL